MSKLREKLLQLAKETRENAYAPYTKYKVGCALVAEDGKIYTGANVESGVCNASVCAEASALFSMISAGSRNVVEIAVVTQSSPAGPPCGICRQRLIEFGSAQTVVYYANIQGEGGTTTIGELLPNAYTPELIHQNAPTPGRPEGS